MQLEAVLLLLVGYLSASYSVPRIPPTTQELQKRYGSALEAILGIGVRLQALIQDPDVSSNRNFLLSPIGTAMVIGQLMIGAEGKLRRDLYNLLSLPEGSHSENSSISYYNKQNTTYHLAYSKLHLQLGSLARALENNDIFRSFTLNASNALFFNRNLKLKDEFEQNLQIYQTEVRALNFSTDPEGSLKAINDWATARTNGVIKNVLSELLPSSAAAVFASVIYFRGDWEFPFSYEANIKGVFHSSKNKSVEVTYMRGNFDVFYGESKNLDCKIMAFPYKDNELSMYFLLPNVNGGEEYDMSKFTEKLKFKDVLELIPQMKNRSVSIMMPKMKLSNTISILKPLQKYQAFQNQQKKLKNERGNALDIIEARVDNFSSFNQSTDEVYLTAAVEDKPMKISNILQEMTLSVDEKGTEAAAVTLSIIDYISNKNFRLDRPFVFFIRHQQTSATLFWGTIVDPSQSL